MMHTRHPARPAPRRSQRHGLGFVLTAAVMVLVAGCTASKSGGNAADGKAGSDSAPSATATTPAPKMPVVALAGGAKKASYEKAVHIAVKDGSFDSVQVNTKSGEELAGAVSGDGTEWVSEKPPRPDSSYQVVASVKNSAGEAETMNSSFKAAAVPDNKRVSFTVTPNDGTTVGIGQPIVVRFMTPIDKRAAIQKAMSVEATTKAGKSVKGSWSWVNSQQIDWRPDKFWEPGTKVALDMKIAGVKAATDRFGRKDYSEAFTIGASHITRFDASTKQVKVYRDDKLVATYPSGGGRPGLETYSGTYVVLGKSPVVQMDSCSARITCDKKDPDYYDEKEYWATRVTASGTFLHAADWDGQLGRANVSHGCIHLSGANAKSFYEHAVPGDVVIVTNSGRGPDERIGTQDPGLYDWNVSRATWKKNSAA